MRSTAHPARNSRRRCPTSVVRSSSSESASHRRGRVERVEPGIGEAVDHPELLDRRAVDLLDLAGQQLQDVEARQHDGELVDDDALGPLEDVDADDVAADGADAGRDETEGTGPVGQPDPDQDMGVFSVSAPATCVAVSDLCFGT